MPSEENLIKVIVVDDSAFMRKTLTLMLESDPEIRVIATARNGQDGIDKIGKLKPDLVTLDIEMPGIDGLATLKFIMEKMPVPVLMVSALTTEGAQATIQALELGAIDFVSKDMSYTPMKTINIKNELIEKVKQIANSRLVQTRFRLKRLVQASQNRHERVKPISRNVSFGRVVLDFQAVVVGISTGGPLALLKIIPKIPENFPIGMAIVQHLPLYFTRTLATRLNSLSNVFVKEAEQGEAIEPGKVMIAPGGKQMTFSKNGSSVRAEISDGPSNILYRPSVDIMMLSAAEVFQGPLLGIIMTGMGRDGVEGLKRIKSKGGYVIAQDEESCVVYGMPRAALEEGLVDSMLSLENISVALDQLANSRVPAHISVGRGEGI